MNLPLAALCVGGGQAFPPGVGGDTDVLEEAWAFTNRGKQKEELYKSPLEDSAEGEGLGMPEATTTERQEQE